MLARVTARLARSAASATPAAIEEKYGSAMSPTIRPSELVRPRAIAWALASGTYWSRSAAASTRWRRSAPTVRMAAPLMAREAVASETPASRATWRNVTGAGTLSG